jgi:hypothetical protein
MRSKANVNIYFAFVGISGNFLFDSEQGGNTAYLLTTNPKPKEPMQKSHNSSNCTLSKVVHKNENLIIARACTDDRRVTSGRRCKLFSIFALIVACCLVTGSMTIAAEPPTPLITKQYMVPPEALDSVRKASPADASASLREVFESMGVPFPEGAFARVAPDNSLIVRNTTENLELMDSLLENHWVKAGGAQ